MKLTAAPDILCLKQKCFKKEEHILGDNAYLYSSYTPRIKWFI